MTHPTAYHLSHLFTVPSLTHSLTQPLTHKDSTQRLAHPIILIHKT